MENPIKMDDLGVPLFLETPIYYIYPFFSQLVGFFFTLKSNSKSGGLASRGEPRFPQDMSKTESIP